MKQTPRNIGAAIKDIYAARNKLRMAFPELSFTLDGNLVGDIGEAIAMHDYKLIPLGKGTKGHDFKTLTGKKVQVKATQQTTKGVGLGQKKEHFEHLVVFQILEDGTYSILFDGPGDYIDKAWEHKKSASLSVLQLKKLNEHVKKNKEHLLK
jgi:hypothetical protein